MESFWKTFKKEQKILLKEAIKAAESDTSGEIRVHIENSCPEEPFDRAVYIFSKLKMHETHLRNGVLFYLAVRDHKFVILGDAGINAVISEGFWETIKQVVFVHFSEGKIVEGLISGIQKAGEALKEYFPHQGGEDVNELDDEISLGEDAEMEI